MAGFNYNPAIDPQAMADQQAIEQQRELGNLLMQQGLQQNGGTQMAGPIAIRRSPMEGLANLLRLYAGKQTLDSANRSSVALNQRYAQNLRSMFQGNQQPTQQDQPASYSPAQVSQAGDTALNQGAQTGDIGPTNTNAQRQIAALRGMTPEVQPQQPQQSGGGMTIPGMNPDQAMMTSMMYPEAYGSALMDRYKQTPEMKNIAAAYGDNSPQYQTAMRDLAQKSTYIAPTRLGEGAYADTSGVHGLAPAAPPGFINNYKSDGTVSVEPIANGLNALSQSTGTKTGAEEYNKIIMVKTASGAMVPMWAGNAVSGSGGRQNTVVSSSQIAPQQNAMDFPGMSRQQVMEQGARIKDPTERAQFMSQLNQSPQMQDSQNAWTSMPKMPQPGGIGQSTFNENMQKGAAETASKLSEKYGASADSANQRLALNKQALDLVETASTGAGASMLAPVQNALVSMGVPESVFNHPVSDTVALQKDLVNAATAKAKQQFGARITQSEVNLMLSRGSPNVDMPKAAIRYLLQSDNATANYQIQQANDLGKYIQNNGDPYRFEGWYSQKFPLSNAIATVTMDNGKNNQTPKATVNTPPMLSTSKSGKPIISNDGGKTWEYK